jgi:hypothetical protein
MLTTRHYRVGARSWLVYGVPGLALLCGVAVALLRLTPAAAMAVAGVCGAVAAVGCWKLLTLQPLPPPATLTIGPGLWVSLWAYVGLSVAALLARAR